MKPAILIFCVIFCTGCLCVNEPRQTRVCRVVNADTFQPISGAKVWMQPYAPIHPFWPPGDKGVTDANGEVKLSAPPRWRFLVLLFQRYDCRWVHERAYHECADAGW